MASDESLNWVKSKSIGEVSEIAVLAPILPGFIPGERRTYEERLRAALDNLQGLLNDGLPNEQDRVRSIHFGRVIIIRPEHYLVYSKYTGIDYRNSEPPRENGHGNIPKLIDDYQEIPPKAGSTGDEKPVYRSWVQTLVEFDGDLKVYFRDIAQYLSTSFDRIFENCDDYPGTAKFEPFWAWIKRYQLESNLFYPRYTDLNMVRIRQLQEFKRQFDEFVVTVRSATGSRVKSMDELFDDFLRRSQQYSSDFPTPGGTFVQRGK